jgi:hypothetical protein
MGCRLSKLKYENISNRVFNKIETESSLHFNSIFDIYNDTNKNLLICNNESIISFNTIKNKSVCFDKPNKPLSKVVRLHNDIWSVSRELSLQKVQSKPF